MSNDNNKTGTFAVIPVTCREEDSICGGRHFIMTGDIFIFPNENLARDGILNISRFLSCGDENQRLLLMPAEFIMIPRKDDDK